MNYMCAGCGAALRFPQWECVSCKTDFCAGCANKVPQHAKCAAPLAPFRAPELLPAVEMVEDSG